MIRVRFDRPADLVEGSDLKDLDLRPVFLPHQFGGAFQHRLHLGLDIQGAAGREHLVGMPVALPIP